MQQRESSIILRRIPYGEADLIVTLFGRDTGKMSGIARHALKSIRRFGGALEPGTLVDLAYRKRRSDLVWIEEAKVIRGVTGAMKSLDRLNAMARAIQLATAFIQEHQASPEKFDLLDARVAAISEGHLEVSSELTFELLWLRLCGFGPNLSTCAGCGRPAEVAGQWSFDLGRGGIVCSDCSRSAWGKLPLTKSAVLGLFGHPSQGTTVDNSCAAEALRIIREYTAHILGRRLKTWEYKPGTRDPGPEIRNPRPETPSPRPSPPRGEGKEV